MLDKHTSNLNFTESRVRNKKNMHKESVDCQCNVVYSNKILTPLFLQPKRTK